LARTTRSRLLRGVRERPARNPDGRRGPRPVPGHNPKRGSRRPEEGPSYRHAKREAGRRSHRPSERDPREEGLTMASIKKRPDGRWRARYRDDDGKEHAHHAPTRAAAQRWLDGQTAA